MSKHFAYWGIVRHRRNLLDRILEDCPGSEVPINEIVWILIRTTHASWGDCREEVIYPVVEQRGLEIRRSPLGYRKAIVDVRINREILASERGLWID